MNCGGRLIAPSPTDTIETNPNGFNLDRYLPRELVTKLESARARNSMVGERRIITMLFCDVKGSTAAAEKVDPETWTDIMNNVFEYMIRPIYKYEGLVPRLMGDAILAFFGAPITHEDDPQRAVLAGLEIQSGIQPFVEEIRLKHGLDLGLRVGINTGLVVVGEIGSNLRMEYTAIGDAINLAARMEQTAAVGSIQISEETFRLVAPFFDVEPLGEVEVKGKSALVKTYRVLRAKSTPGQLRGLEGLSSALVGREAHLALLKECLRNLDAGMGSMIAITGEAGLGKSSLITEVKKPEEGAHHSWLKGDSLSYTHSTSYYPWRQIIRQSVEAQENDLPADVRQKLSYSCDCCTLPGGDIPFLEAMLAVESEESAKVVMGYQGDALTRRMIDATRGFLCGLAMANPRVIVFDDLHWADEASLQLLQAVADLSTNHPILFVCMLRPDQDAASWSSIQQIGEKLRENFHSMTLAPLQTEQTSTLLENLLGRQGLPAFIRDIIIAKAEGNPFFVEEIIRSLIETRQIVRENSHWRAVSDSANIALPTTLRGVLSARIDRLPEISKYVLQNAAVVGRSFDLRVLRRLISLNEELNTQIQYLMDVSLIESWLNEYAFRHVLIQESAYESILLKSRAGLHRQIGEIMEELHADRIEEFAPLLAHHFYAAQDGRSLQYDILSGEKAARLFANAEAITHFQRALEVARRQNADLNQIRYLFSELGRVLELSGRYTEALDNYDAWQEYGRSRGDRSIKMSALMAKAPLYSIFTPLHDSAMSERLLVQALEISQEIGDRAAQARLSWNLMLNYLFAKQLDQALEHGERALSLARGSEDREQLAYVLNDLCRLYTCRGEFEKAYGVIEEARALWRSLDNEVMLADSLGSEAEARFNAGQFERSIQRSREALQITERIENYWGQSYDKMLMSFVLLERADLGQGIQLAEQSIQLADRAGLIASAIGLRSELAWIYSYCGALQKGLEVVDVAFQVAETRQPAWKAFPQAAKTRMYLLQGDIQSALETAGERLLEPISIPYARYTIFLSLANVELAISKGEYEFALDLAEALLKEVFPLTHVDVPDVLHWKGLALLGLGRIDESYQTLTEARVLAEESGCNLQLWYILQMLADIDAEQGHPEEAAAKRQAALQIVERIAESLHETGLDDVFLNQPRIQRLRGWIHRR
jgi:class 3 adenylate cyclase/tetratricopeptide (TPR) repeat protein